MWRTELGDRSLSFRSNSALCVCFVGVSACVTSMHHEISGLSVSMIDDGSCLILEIGNFLGVSITCMHYGVSMFFTLLYLGLLISCLGGFDWISQCRMIVQL